MYSSFERGLGNTAWEKQPAPSGHTGPITQLSPCLTQNRCKPCYRHCNKWRIPQVLPHHGCIRCCRRENGIGSNSPLLSRGPTEGVSTVSIAPWNEMIHPIMESNSVTLCTQRYLFLRKMWAKAGITNENSIAYKLNMQKEILVQCVANMGLLCMPLMIQGIPSSRNVSQWYLISFPSSFSSLRVQDWWTNQPRDIWVRHLIWEPWSVFMNYLLKVGYVAWLSRFRAHRRSPEALLHHGVQEERRQKRRLWHWPLALQVWSMICGHNW